MSMRVLPDFCIRYHQNSRFSCVPCKKEFRSKESILQHLTNVSKKELHEREKNHECQCGKNFSSAEEFVNHLEFDEVHISSLHNAVCQGNYRVAVRLCRCAEDLDRKCRSHDVAEAEDTNKIGNTPLHCAILNNFYKCTSNLLEWGANPNAKDEFGWTPVHIAVVRGKVKTIMSLLAHDGNIFELNNERQTPFDLAKRKVKQQILQLLFTFGVKDGQFRATGMKNPRLAEQVIRQFEEFKRNNNISVTECTPSNVIIENCGDEESDAGERGDEGSSCSMNETFGYEELLNKDSTKMIYSDVLEHGKEKITHGKILVLGPVGSGKSSLVRNLSGKEFKAGRQETEGIESVFVNTVNLDQSWQEVADTGWTCDEAVARHVAECLLELLVKNKSLSGKLKQLTLSDPSSASDGSFQVVSSQPLSIEKPVKDKIIKNLENPECITEQFKLSIWDFAGHELYQTMHHIFLSAKAMYLLCFSLAEFKKNHEKTVDDLNYWLNSIAAHKAASQPAVFVIATHVDLENEATLIQANEFIKSRLFQKFVTFFVLPSDREMAFPIDNTKGPDDENLKYLQSEIKKEAQTSEDCVDEINIRWLFCEKELHKLIHEDLRAFSKTKSELREHLSALECKITTDEDEFQKMLETFHHSGILWLPELLVKDPAAIGSLSDIVILNIQHLMDAMTAVCQLCCEKDIVKTERHHRKIAQLLQSDAKISHDNLKRMLCKCFTSTDQMILLLQIFNIILPAEKINLKTNDFHPEPGYTSTPNRNVSKQVTHEYIIPSLLPDQPLDDEWALTCKDIGEFLFYIDFFDFVPQAIFHQLLVQVAEHSVQSASFEPMLRRSDGIFGFDDRFTFRLQLLEASCQVEGRLRADHVGKAGDLMVQLKDILTSVCENFFRFQRFKIGPACPLENCPGSNPDGSKIKHMVRDVEDGAANNSTRRFVIDLDPKEIRPIYCATQRVDTNKEVQRWNLLRLHSTENLPPGDNDAVDLVHSTSVDSGMEEVSSASLNVIDVDIKKKISDKLGDSWVELGRCLGFSEQEDVDALIQNIQQDNPHNQREQAYQLLNKWCHDRGENATIGNLDEALCKCKRADLAVSLRRFSFTKT